MKVLLVVIDAATPRVVCPAIQTGRLRNLQRLADAGEMHQESTTIFPSITPAATSSIITGAYPAEHGIVGASWYDDATGEVAYFGDDFWVAAKKGFGAFMRDFLVRLNGDRLRAPTLFELVERTGRGAACLNYLIYRGLVRHRVRIPWQLTLLPGVPFTESVDGPSLLCLGDFVTAHPRRRSAPHHGGLLHRFGMDDAATTELLVDLAGRGALPELTVAYFADNDYRSHEVGPHAALPVVDRVDAALGAMFDAAGGFDRFMRDTMVIVTSDHGHTEVLDDADRASICIDDVLGDYAQAIVGLPWGARDEILICANMRAAQIYVKDRQALPLEQVAHTCLLDPRIDLILWKSAWAPAGAVYSALGPRGRLDFWREGAGPPAGERGEDVYGTAWRWRGDLETLQLERDGRLLASFEYPNAFERIAGGLDAGHSGDLWVTAAPGCEFDVAGGDSAHVAGSSHGSLHALDSRCPVIAANAPRRLPRAMRSVDVAPLIMEALGLPMRYAVGDARDGKAQIPLLR